MDSLIKKIKPEIKAIVESLNLYLIDIKFFKEIKDYLLEIFIDEKGGLTMDRCEEASKEINRYLDEKDPINQEYTLIVSSPGLDRSLETDLDFELAKDYEVEVNFYTSLKGQKKIYGILKNIDDEKIYLTLDDEQVEISRNEVSKITKSIRI